jgi:RNA polymerase sigma-70 factor (ECF subfamily)
MRTNEEWLRDLHSDSPQQAEAIEALRLLLLRAALFTFQRNLGDFQHHSQPELVRMAEDCTQDALLALLARLPEFRGESKFTTWAYKFAVNMALTAARRERWRGVSLDMGELADGTGEVHLPAAQPSAGPAGVFSQQEARRLLLEIIRTELTERQRLVVKLMFFDDVPMDVVVERLDTNRNAVYKLLHDARKKLKAALETRGFAIEEVIHLFSWEG